MKMSHHPRKILPPGLSKKRKEREPFSFPIKPSAAAVPPPPAASKKAIEPICSNRLLAGYMAYEFLTKGTLFGKKKFAVPARAEAASARSGGSAELKRVKREAELGGGKEEDEEDGSYDEVASVMKSDGVHIPGIVNPTQLARWTQAEN